MNHIPISDRNQVKLDFFLREKKMKYKQIALQCTVRSKSVYYDIFVQKIDFCKHKSCDNLLSCLLNGHKKHVIVRTTATNTHAISHQRKK